MKNKTTRKRKYRKSISGVRMLEAPSPVKITIETLCPKKWVIVDTESGHVYCKKDDGDAWYSPSKETLEDAKECIHSTIREYY